MSHPRGPYPRHAAGLAGDVEQVSRIIDEAAAVGEVDELGAAEELDADGGHLEDQRTCGDRIEPEIEAQKVAGPKK